MFETLLGNEEVKQDLRVALQRGRLGNSLLFAGPQGIGKSLFARELAAELVGSSQQHHPDIRWYSPEGRAALHSIESMRRFSEEVYLAPYQSHAKVFIIDDADRMSPFSANALLKTFEEPASDAVIILLTAHPDRLLGTIRSRCRFVRFSPLGIEVIQQKVEDPIAARLAEGSLARGLHLQEERSRQLREQVLHLLADVPLSYGELLPVVKEIAEGLEQLRTEGEGRVRAGQGEKEHLSAVHREALEKEAEGAGSVAYKEAVEELFGLVLTWYRDLAAVAVGATGEVVLQGYEEQLKAVPRRVGLEGVSRLMEQARLGVERGIPIAAVLENLFLRL